MQRHNQGFTLLEVLLAVAISGIVSSVIFFLFNACFTLWDRSTEREDLSIRGKTTLDNITRSIREAREIIEVGDHYISLKARDNKIYSYSLQENKIFKVSGGESMPLIENISDFDLSNKNGFINISIKIETEHASLSYRTGAIMRNSIYVMEQLQRLIKPQITKKL